MKVVTLSTPQIVKAIKGADSRQRNEAIQSLYVDQTVRLKVGEWLGNYKLNKFEVGDVLQQALVALDDNIRGDKFKGDANVRTYLLAICRNVIRSEVRKTDRITYDEELTMNREKDAFDGEVGFDPLSGEEEERDEVLLKIIREMKENCRKGIQLFHLYGKTMAKVAEELGLKNANQAKKAVSRCRKQLRQLIEDHPLFDELFSELT